MIFTISNLEIHLRLATEHAPQISLEESPFDCFDG